MLTVLCVLKHIETQVRCTLRLEQWTTRCTKRYCTPVHHQGKGAVMI